MVRHQSVSSEHLFSYEVVGLAPSWQCDARCRHCFLPSDARTNSSSPNQQLFLKLLQSIPSEIQHIEITGGEPLIHPAFLIAVIKEASALGLTTSIVTNGLWARDRKQLKTTISRLAQAGLGGIAISIDSYHRPQVSDAVLLDFLIEAKNAGIIVRIKGCGKTSAPRLKHYARSGLLIESVWSTDNFSMENIGTAQQLDRDIVNRVCESGCWLATLPLVLPDGRVIACCSARMLEINNNVLFLGNVKEVSLGKILVRARHNLLLGAVVGFGPVGMAKIIKKKINQNDTTMCALCLSILNDPTCRMRLLEKLSTDKELRKEMAGRIMLQENKYDSILEDVRTKARQIFSKKK